jgi:hypothetical protein
VPSPSCQAGAQFIPPSKSAMRANALLALVAAATRAYAAPCDNWCADDVNPWESKCGKLDSGDWAYPTCYGCSECSDPAIATWVSPPAPPAELENCRDWCADNTRTWAIKCDRVEFPSCYACAPCLTSPPPSPPSAPPIFENTVQGQLVYLGGAAVFLLITAVVRPAAPILAALAAAPSRDPHSLLESPHRQAAYVIHVRAKVDASAVERWQDAEVSSNQSKMRKGVGAAVRVSAASSASHRPRNPAMLKRLFVSWSAARAGEVLRELGVP